MLVVMVVLAVEPAVEAVAVCTTVIVAEYSGTVRGENGTGSGRSAGSNATIGPEVSAAELRKSRVQRSCAYVEEHQVKQRSCWWITTLVHWNCAISLYVLRTGTARHTRGQRA